MDNLSKMISDLSRKNVTRKQFLAIMGGGFLSMFGVFRYLQAINLPDTDVVDNKGAFGASDYGGDLERQWKNPATTKTIRVVSR